MLIHLCIASNNDSHAINIQTLPPKTLLPKGSNLESVLFCLLYTLQCQLLFQHCRICTENLCYIWQSVFQPVVPRGTHSYESLHNQALWCLAVIVKHWTSCTQWSFSILRSKKKAGCVRKGIEGARSGYHCFTMKYCFNQLPWTWEQDAFSY